MSSEDLDYFYFHIGVPSNFFVLDNEGNVVLKALDLFPPIEVEWDYTYRARIFSYNEIRSLTWN